VQAGDAGQEAQDQQQLVLGKQRNFEEQAAVAAVTHQLQLLQQQLDKEREQHAREVAHLRDVEEEKRTRLEAQMDLCKLERAAMQECSNRYANAALLAFASCCNVKI